MIIPVYIQWEIDPAFLPYRQWFGTAECISHAATAIESETEHVTTMCEIQLYIMNRSTEGWDTRGSMRIQDVNQIDSLEPGSRFWLCDGAMIAVVTVLDRAIDPLHTPISRYVFDERSGTDAPYYKSGDDPNGMPPHERWHGMSLL